jgi:16S rRNA (cytosine1402-N4)-methyltransferase
MTGMDAAAGHVPVLRESVIRTLAPAPGESAVDLTAGRGGHAEDLARRISPGGSLLVCDLDRGNLDHASDRARAVPGVTVHAFHGNFALADREAARLGLAADCVLADLGFASTQMDDPGRGFSFQAEGPLDMRLDRSRGESAAELLARLPERDLADAIFRLGEDPFARRIAREVADRRVRQPIVTTTELAAAVVAAYGSRARQSRMHPATRTFMALRILVNDELRALEGLLAGLQAGGRQAAQGKGGWIRPGCRAGVISFHSLEDRMVKQAMAAWEAAGLGERLTRKPVEPTDAEVFANRRARSAKLRVFRFGTVPAPGV